MGNGRLSIGIYQVHLHGPWIMDHVKFTFRDPVKTKKVPLFLASLLLAFLTLSAVSVDRLKAHVTWLADPAREGRQASTPGAAAAAEYIARQLKEIGCDVQMQDFGRMRRNVIGRI